MGFGKFILGAVGAAGAVVAAPVILPTVVVSTGMAAAIGGTVGVAAGAMQEKKVENAYNEGVKHGYDRASQKFAEWAEEYKETFYNQEKEFDNTRAIYDELISKMENYIDYLEKQLGNSDEAEREYAEMQRIYYDFQDAVA